MNDNPAHDGYMLVGSRVDPDTGRQFEFCAKRALSEAQLEEEFSLWRQFVKQKHPYYKGGTLTVRIEDAYFSDPEKRPIQPPVPTRGNGP